jgi:acetyl esterase
LVSRLRSQPFPDCPGSTEELTVPTSVAPARVRVYRPEPAGPDRDRPAVHVNFHGGGYVMRGAELDDPLCRFLAARAGVVVINVDYVVAPGHRFPAAVHQAFEVVRWVHDRGPEYGWDPARLTVGGQSAGGGLAAAVARQAWNRGGPAIALQVLHYPPLDLVTPTRAKTSTIRRPLLRPWLGAVFDAAYVPDPGRRADPLVSPAGPDDVTDLTGLAPALIIACEQDRLRAEAERYAERLRRVHALAGWHLVRDRDHSYDMTDRVTAEETYTVIVEHLTRATGPRSAGS